MVRGVPNTVEMIWALVDKSGGEDACWPWRGSIDDAGYGRVTYKWRNYPAHRFVWMLTHGKIRNTRRGKMFVCHKCDNPPCVNPAHLFLGTHRDNMDDMRAKGRQAKTWRVKWASG